MVGSADEIAKIERELELLRERRANYERGAEWVRRTLIVAGIVLVGLITWRLVLADVFGAILITLIVGSFILSGLHSRRRGRDILSQLTISWYGGRADFSEVEEMIASREKRLAEIQGQKP